MPPGIISDVHNVQRSRRDAVTAAGEALLIEVDGTKTPVTAITVERWSQPERDNSRFVCSGCDVRVRPWNIHSTKRSPTFHPSPDSHRDDCKSFVRDGNDGRAAAARTVETGRMPSVPTALVLDAEPTRSDRTIEDSNPPTAGRQRSRTNSSSPLGIVVAGRSNQARALGRVVDAWIQLGSRESRLASPLRVPTVDADNYAYAFKRLDAWDSDIAASPPRVYYAGLRFVAPPIQDDDLLTITLQPTQPRSRLKANPRLAQLVIDRSGWSAGRHTALRRDLDWAYHQARTLWYDSKELVTVFFVGSQSDTAHSVFTTTDQRLIYLTDDTITY